MEKNLDKERKYNRAKTILSSKFKTKEDYERALNLLKECPEYEDAEKLIQFCQEKINGNEKDRKNKIISLIIIVVIIFIICLIPLVVNFIKYNNAIKMSNNKEYLQAAETFETIEYFMDAEQKKNENYLNYSITLINEEKYEEALDYLYKIKNYKNASNKIKETYYKLGLYNLKEKNYLEAISNFEEAKDYSDAKNKLLDAKYEYVINNKDRNNSYTLTYSTDLWNEGYPNGKKIYDEIFGWTGEIVVKNTSGKVITSTSNRYESWNFVLTVHGGKPDERATFYWYTYDSNGNEVSTGSTCRLEDEGKCKYPHYGIGRHGTYTAIVYVGYASKENKIAEYSFVVK